MVALLDILKYSFYLVHVSCSLIEAVVCSVACKGTENSDNLTLVNISEMGELVSKFERFY